MKALIFGVNGQDGVYLNTLLLQKGIEVIGVARNNADFTGDVGDMEFVQNVIKKYLPE